MAPRNYSYDSQGRLAKDADPAGGFTAVTRSSRPSGFAWNVERVTAMGRASNFQTTLDLPWVENSSSTFAEQHVNIAPCGVKSTYTQTQANNRLSESENLGYSTRLER